MEEKIWRLVLFGIVCVFLFSLANAKIPYVIINEDQIGNVSGGGEMNYTNVAMTNQSNSFSGNITAQFFNVTEDIYIRDRTVYDWLYNQSNATFEMWNSTWDNRGLINTSWTQSLADTLYCAIGDCNSSWNQSLANTLYIATGNQSIYDGLINNASYLSTFNATYQDFINNESNFNVNSSNFWDNLDSPLDSWLSTYNSTYDYWSKDYYVNITGDTMTGNLSTSEWFNGKFNWTSADDWNIFDGSILDFNDTKLSSVYYNATTSLLVTGTIDGGTLVDTQHNDADYDGNTLNFSEASGSPALDLRVNFTGVTDFSRGVMRYKTSSLSGDYPVRQLWNYDTSTWETLAFFVTSEDFVAVTQPVFNNANYVQDGVVQMRIYKADNGKINNHYYIDWVAMVGGYGVPSGQEIDPYSFHMSENLDNTGYNITADWGFMKINYSDIQNAFNFTIDTFNLYNSTWDQSNYFDLHNSTWDNRGLINNSWAQSLADTLYSPIGSAGGNASWNQSYANSLYAPNTTSGIQHLINGTSMNFSKITAINVTVSDSILSNFIGSIASRVSKIWADEADITFINNTDLNTTGDLYIEDSVLTRAGTNTKFGINENGTIVIGYTE